jgi:predicted Fe-S protein YdhL (DUF1289 family)
MKTRMMTATAVALMLCAPALAQTTTSDTANSSANMSSAMPQGWNDELGNAFFSDPELGTLRTEDEIGTNWASLSAEQKAQVTGYCDTMDTASATGTAGSSMSGDAAATGTASTDTTAGATTGTAGTTASPSIAGDSTPSTTSDTTAGASGGVSTDTTASTSQNGSTTATGGMDAGAGTNIASMQQLCDVVGDLD